MAGDGGGGGSGGSRGEVRGWLGEGTDINIRQ